MIRGRNVLARVNWVPIVQQFARVSCALLTLEILIDPSSAEYKYISKDPLEIHKKFVVDMQLGQVEQNSLSQTGKEALYRLSNFPPAYASLANMGKLNRICLFLIIQYPTGRSFSFRTVHQNGCVDWVVWASSKPELVQNLSMFSRSRPADQLNNCGAPAILPMGPLASDRVLPPTQFDCREANEVIQPANSGELEKACTLWPDMCR